MVGDLVYSIDLGGWQCGDTKASYLAENVHRDGIGQILAVTEEDVIKLQDNLNKSCGTGTYGFLSDICTGKVSRVLDEALKENVLQVENPQLFVGYLEAKGIVEKRQFYPKRK